MEVRGFCGSPNFPGPWSATTIFTTSNSCVAPSSLNEINITGTSATVTWTTVPNTNYYQIRYRTAAGPGAWQNGTAPGTSTSKNYTGLTINTTYEWQIRAVCNPAPYTTGPWSMLGDFTTLASKPGDVTANNETLDHTVAVYPNPTRDILTSRPCCRKYTTYCCQVVRHEWSFSKTTSISARSRGTKYDPEFV
ncbi:MAG: fibronectin type III domain-containing protein [Bacteroidota bacterium]|nr:MAG: fibronectin type III domain-containing protein [Bacteroidota bacterium]